MKISIIFFLLSILFFISMIVGIINIRRKKKVKKKQVSVKFLNSFSYLKLPLINITINGRKLIFLIDSGSTLNLVDNKALSGMTFLTSGNRSSLSGFGKGAVHSLEINVFIGLFNELIKAEIHFSDMSRTFERVKNDTGIEISGILGSIFLEENKIIIDYANKLVKRG